MDIPGQLIVVLVLGGSVLVAVLAVALMRYLYRVSGHEQVYKNGIVVTEGGIEYLGLLFTGTRRVAFSEIDSVELRPYFEVAGRALILRYGLNVNRVPPNLFGDILVVGFKRANPFRYLFFAPKDGAVIYEQIKSRICHQTPVA